MNLPVEVIEAVRQGRCVLFLGSRTSMEAAELADLSYPDAAALAKNLGWKKPPPTPGSKPAKGVLPSVEEGAQIYEDKHGRPKLLASLKEWIGQSQKPSVAHEIALARFPLIFTTAIDGLLEQVGKPLTVQDRQTPFPTSIDAQNPTLIRLRGRLDQPNCLISKRDIDAQPLSADQRRQLRTLIRNHVVLFVGFRPDEEEFERLFAELSDAYGGELPRCHLAVAQGSIDDYLWQKWVWRGLLMFMADPSEAMQSLESQLV